MKKFLPLILLSFLVLLAGCGSQKPLTEEEQAAQYGFTIERYREEKAAAARMGMKWEDHVKTIQNNSGRSGMDM